mmetsp:Transcript_90786/g.136003  ORF Transcript_90786/g.136003 Transcript_90786/m.136003 type:complete len:309 (-) Transcript_90786:28-954(-)
MPRGSDAKLRRRNKKKEDAAEADRMLVGDEDENEGNEHEFGMPMPPGMSGAEVEKDSDEEDEAPVEKKKKKKKSKARAAGDDSMQMPPQKKKKGINSTPLILLILMTGSTLLPALIYASDYLGNYMQKHHVLGELGFRLGMGAVPKKRVLSFYEKHDPEKLNDVPDILSKYYGDYPKLVKRLERKYQDYGYFMGWEEDEAPMALAMEKLQETYDTWIHSYWNVYAPQQLKTAARNIRYNLTFLHKKLHKAWKKHVWPLLEPIFGVPKGAEKQKRMDAAEARKRKQGASGSSDGARRRSSQFRDDVEEE